MAVVGVQQEKEAMQEAVNSVPVDVVNPTML